MATTKEIKKYIESKFKYEFIEELDAYRLNFALEGDRTQVIFLSVGDPFIEIYSPFGDANELSPKNALEVSRQYPFGIGMAGEFYVVRHCIPIDDLDESEIDFGIDAVTHVADRLEEELGQDNF